MSDFLTRISARAVGEIPVTRPKLSDLLEQRQAGADVGFETVDDEVIAPAPVLARRAEGSPEVVSATAVTASPLSGRRDRALSPIAEHDGPAPVQAGKSLEPEANVKSDSAETIIKGHVRARPAMSQPAPSRIAGSAEPAMLTSDALRSVLVHIGKLEVRAILQDEPPRQRRREVSPPAGLSLDDYLRGKRDVG